MERAGDQCVLFGGGALCLGDEELQCNFLCVSRDLCK